tara:strand:- start:1414 stop:1617 length:204 start_codon:yes stop_codon:yes gene_type:complete
VIKITTLSATLQFVKTTESPELIKVLFVVKHASGTTISSFSHEEKNTNVVKVAIIKVNKWCEVKFMI